MRKAACGRHQGSDAVAVAMVVLIARERRGARGPRSRKVKQQKGLESTYVKCLPLQLNVGWQRICGKDGQ